MDEDYKRALDDLSFTDTSHILSSGRSEARGLLSANLSAGMKLSSPIPPNVQTEVDTNVHPSGIVPVLQNVVATSALGCKLDLKHIAQHARNAEYNPKRFAAVIMRIREPKTTALIFSSGKMVCTGAKSEQDSRLASRKYAKIVMKLGYNVTFQEFTIQNIVGSCDVMFPIGLEQLNFKHSLFTRYEPELFPGLIYKMKSPKIVLLIFVSGKVVLTGAKKRSEIYQAFENIYPTLTEFQKTRRKPVRELHIEDSSQKPSHLPMTPSADTAPHDLQSDAKSESKACMSPFMSSLSQSFVDDARSIHLSGSMDYRSAVLPDSFYSLVSPPSVQVAASGESGSIQLQQAPSTPHVGSCISNTPQIHFIRPPTPQV